MIARILPRRLLRLARHSFWWSSASLLRRRDAYARVAAADLTFALHLFLIPVFSLVGLAGCSLTSGLHGRASHISRGALGVFAILYVALDTFAVVSQGASFMVARTFPTEQQAALYAFVSAVLTSPLGSGVILGLFVAGTLALIVGMARRPWRSIRAALPANRASCLCWLECC